MKTKLIVILLVLFVIGGSIFTANSQTLRNPVLEYCTGTWCQWCPCGHTVIRDQILPAYPNTIIIGYHGPANGSDPFSTFSGNTIISSLGLSSYPTGIPDRTSSPISRSAWFGAIGYRTAQAAKVDITTIKNYDSLSRQLSATFYVTPLVDLTGQFKISFILLEDELVYAQTGNTSCPGGTEYRHQHVVRAMINGALGENINTNSTWNTGEMLSKSYNYTVPSNFVANNCHIVAFVYKEASPLNTGEIQQAKQWTLKGSILPVELTSFNASTSADGITLTWKTSTEINNLGFEIERSLDAKEFFKVGFSKGSGTTTEAKTYNFIDKVSFDERKTVYYRLKQVDYNGTYEYSDVIAVSYDRPQEFSLEQNYPNPFNPSTFIKYAIAKSGMVQLKVYDPLGNEVATLVNEVKNAGTYDIMFDANSLSSGTYFYKLISGEFISVRKMIVVK